MDVKLTPQMEDYLEAILQICQRDGVARIKEIAAHMEVTNASVVGAIKRLKRMGLVDQEPYGYVQLTDKGESVADTILHRHEVLTDFLEKILCLDPKLAAREACVIEHSLSPETVLRFRAMADFLQREDKEEVLEEFKRYCEGKE
jgi:DtxR family Mn-dependent transcriptional regulator